jgi:hypothetical protein
VESRKNQPERATELLTELLWKDPSLWKVGPRGNNRGRFLRAFLVSRAREYQNPIVGVGGGVESG